MKITFLLLGTYSHLARKPFWKGQSYIELLTMWNKTGVFSAMGCFPVTDCWGCNLSSCSWNLCLLCLSFICSSFWDISLLVSSVLKNIQILLCLSFSLGRKSNLVHLFAFLFADIYTTHLTVNHDVKGENRFRKCLWCLWGDTRSCHWMKSPLLKKKPNNKTKHNTQKEADLKHLISSNNLLGDQNSIKQRHACDVSFPCPHQNSQSNSFPFPICYNTVTILPRAKAFHLSVLWCLQKDLICHFHGKY